MGLAYATCIAHPYTYEEHREIRTSNQALR